MRNQGDPLKARPSLIGRGEFVIRRLLAFAVVAVLLGGCLNYLLLAFRESRDFRHYLNTGRGVIQGYNPYLFNDGICRYPPPRRYYILWWHCLILLIPA